MPSFLLLVAVGLVGAVALVVSARLSGFDRDRTVYPTVLCVIALLYVLFGVQAGGASIVAAVAAVALAFVAAAVAAHRRGSAALLTGGLAAHGLWDLAHPLVLWHRARVVGAVLPRSRHRARHLRRLPLAPSSSPHTNT